MKTKLMAAGLAVCTSLVANGADGQVNADLVARAADNLTAEPTVRYFGRRGEPVALWRSDLQIRGPLVDTFRRPRSEWSDMSLPDKLTAIPIVGLFVPQPMPRPPANRGRYFAWGQSDRAWVDLADHVPPGPQTSLVTFTRSKKD